MSQRRSCGRKVRYPNAHLARKALAAIKARKNVIGCPEAYPCHHCGGWHLGNAAGTGRAIAAQRTINKISAALAADIAKRKGETTP